MTWQGRSAPVRGSAAAGMPRDKPIVLSRYGEVASGTSGTGRFDEPREPAIRGDAEMGKAPTAHSGHAGAGPRERPLSGNAAAEGTRGPRNRPAIRLCRASAQQRPRDQLAAAPGARAGRPPDHALDDGRGVHGHALAQRRARQALAQRHARSLVAAGQDAVVADLGEAPGQHVHQEAADELVGRQRAALDAVAVARVAVVELHAAPVAGLDSAVRYRHPVRVAAQVGQHAAGVAEQ